MIDRYPCDGFFYDIVMYHPDGCACVNCLAELRHEGRNPRDPEHRRLHNQAVARLRREAPTGRVLLAHSGAELPFAIVPRVDAHTMVVFEG